MRKLTIILLMITGMNLSVQANSNMAKIDSILGNVSDYQSSIMMLRNIPSSDLYHHIRNTDDVGKVKLYNALCWIYFSSNPPKAMEYAKLQNELAEKLNHSEMRIAAYDNMAYLYMGFGDNDKAINYMLKCLKAKEANKDTAGVSVSLSGLAGVYYGMNNYKLALKYFNQAYQIEKDAERKVREAQVLNNIGLCHTGLGDIDKGLDSYFKTVEIYKEMGIEQKAASAYLNIGISYKDKNEYDKSLTYFEKAATMHEKSGNVSNLSLVYRNISEVHSLEGNFDKALVYGKKAVKYAHLSKDKNAILKSNSKLANIFYRNRDYQLAYEHFKIAFDIKDTIFSETSSKQIAEMQTKYDTEKKEAENKLLLAEKELDKVELDKKSAQQKMLGIGLGLTLIVVIYIGYSLNQKKKTNKLLNAQNEEISNKNQIIEEKNKDITDSINYAQRIQNAILPVDGLLQKHFDSFVYYRPKDIVSGDFYWIKEVGNKIYFSVVDCTGHGVPGAFMSIIGYNSLNRIVDDFNITKTGMMLDKLNELVTDAVGGKPDEELSIRDGMDMSICCIDRSTNMLEYSGAQNSLYLLREGSNTIEEKEPIFNENGTLFYEVRADKMAIGGGKNANHYQTHSFQLAPEDTIYLFSDGYADQFGGPKGKKFMYKRFKKMLFDIKSQPMDQQLSHINNTMVEWMGDIEQLDDICVMGVKV